ncbi:MAG: class I SAM-dependent RNA methyltransferase [Candidatus Omnitrophica bacterium]|nr:class I SAM-dependent RNA methyltransferase [Candidatus Omnitrophota bacterium]
MLPTIKEEILLENRAQPLCPVFGQCGGCQYQDMTYEAELTLKQEYLESVFQSQGIIVENGFAKIVASPLPYHYRSRLDMKFLKTRDGRTFMGFSPLNGKWMIEVESCPIAMPAISDFLPQLKKEAIAKLPAKYRNANLVIKTGDDRRLAWGGIGRRSLKLQEDDFLWTEIAGKKIFYSLDTFFQANLAILPDAIKHIRDLKIIDEKTTLYDLYGGVGLFGICLSDVAAKIILIEDNIHSVAMAQYNVNYHGLQNFEIISGRVEVVYPEFLQKKSFGPQVALIDPPRQGLASSVAHAIAEAKNVSSLLYLSCHPESLLRDLQIFVKSDWGVRKVIPFDFFPRTRHIETLVLLQPKDNL